MMELTLYINGMMCANCSQKLEEKASKLAEIEEIHVNYASAKINVKFNKHRWFSGRIIAFQAVDPGSIPGQCIFILFYLIETKN